MRRMSSKLETGKKKKKKEKSECLDSGGRVVRALVHGTKGTGFEPRSVIELFLKFKSKFLAGLMVPYVMVQQILAPLQ